MSPRHRRSPRRRIERADLYGNAVRFGDANSRRDGSLHAVCVSDLDGCRTQRIHCLDCIQSRNWRSDSGVWRVQEGQIVTRRDRQARGARVIYFLAQDAAIWLLIAYTESKFDNLPATFLAKLKTEVEDVVRD